jgi:hypothetical protein
VKETSISEKTLEVNLCGELLSAFREKYPKAFWYGPTLQDERKVGYDASLENAQGHCLFFQFKRPLKYHGTTPKAFPYWFKIQRDQNNVLHKLTDSFPRAVFYVFPLIGDHDELRDALPRMRDETNFTILELVGEIAGGHDHDVEVWPDRIRVHSPTDASGWSGDDILGMADNWEPNQLTSYAQAYDALIAAAYSTVVDVPAGRLHLFVEEIPRALFLPTEGRRRW